MTSAPVSASPSVLTNSSHSELPWRLQVKLAQNRGPAASPGEVSPNTTASSDTSALLSPADRVFDWATQHGVPLQKAVAMSERVDARLRRRPKTPFSRRKPSGDQPTLVLEGGWLPAQDGVEVPIGEEGVGNGETDLSWQEHNEPIGAWLV